MHSCFPACACGAPVPGRRGFLKRAAAGYLVLRAGVSARSAEPAVPPFPGLPLVDLHVHCTHRGRVDDDVLVHQRNTGVRTTVLLPAGESGGLAAGAAGNEHVAALVRRHPDRFARFANENAFRAGAPRVIERELRAGAIGIGELKDEVTCDSADMTRIAEVAREHDVPMLIHFQDGSYNDGYSRFHRMLEKFPTVRFIGHAQTFWANIDQAAQAPGPNEARPVTRGGLTDRWLEDYPNLYADLSASSGNRALARDPSFTRDFLTRHQDKLLYGSDCFCPTGVGPQCLGAVKLGLLRQFAASDSILQKILFGNARRICRFPASHRA